MATYPTTNIHDIAQRHALKKIGNEYRGTCPICQARKMELAVWEKHQGGIGCHCHYGGCDFKELFRLLIGKEAYLPPSPSIMPINNRTNTERTEWAEKIWQQTIKADNTLAEKYLRGRGITLPISPNIRFHPGLKHAPSNQILPAMVSAIRNVKGEIQAVHRTYLSTFGNGKANIDIPKMTLGPYQGCSIQLAKPDETLGLAEGVESSMSAFQLTGIPTWSVISAGNFKNVLIPSSVKEIIIFSDNDPVGKKATSEAASILVSEGKRVAISTPDKVNDFNDLLTNQWRANTNDNQY